MEIGQSIDNSSEMSTGNGGQSNDSNNVSTANSGQCAESNEIVDCNVTMEIGQSIDNCSEMSTGNGGQSNDSNNLSTAISGQCAESSEIINRSIELGGQSIVNEMSTENSGQLIDSNGKSTEKSGRLISVNNSGPTLNCNNNNDNGNRSTKTSGQVINNSSYQESSPTEIGGQIADHNDHSVNGEDSSMDTTPVVLTPVPALVTPSPCSPEAVFSPGPSDDSVLVAYAQPPSSPYWTLSVNFFLRIPLLVWGLSIVSGIFRAKPRRVLFQDCFPATRKKIPKRLHQSPGTWFLWISLLWCLVVVQGSVNSPINYG